MPMYCPVYTIINLSLVLVVLPLVIAQCRLTCVRQWQEVAAVLCNRYLDVEAAPPLARLTFAGQVLKQKATHECGFRRPTCV